MKHRVLKPLNAVRLTEETIPVGAEIDIDIESGTSDWTVQFNWGGHRFGSTLDEIRLCTDFDPPKSLASKL
jgi:hypothetical protein